LASTPKPPLAGVLLRLAWNAARVHVLAALAVNGFDDLNEAHLSVLRYPEPEGARPVELAQRANMTKQAMNYLLVELERLGYVRRRSGPESTRRLVYLTVRGRRACTVVRAAMAELERSWAARTGPERYAIFLDVLRSLGDAGSTVS